MPAGMTWLELYILDTLHGGKHFAKLRAKTLSLQIAIKQLKRRTRKVALHCIRKEEEWQLHTCEARRNRMEVLAISNKHAGVRGMPDLDGQEATSVTASVLAMRGVNQRKQKQAHQEGNLKLHRRPMAYKGLSRAWLRNLTKARREDDWTIKPKEADAHEVEQIPLKQIGCPECGFIQNTAKNRLRAKIGYGQMTCQRCRHVTKSPRWTCNCNINWPKCNLHVHADHLSKASLRVESSKRGRECSDMGTNEPLPKRRREEGTALAISHSELPKITRELKPGTTLHRLFAKRFPHLVQAEVPTKGY